MSQIALVALIGAAGWVAWKSFGPVRKRTAAPEAKPRATPLELDPETGIYRPAERDDR